MITLGVIGAGIMGERMLRAALEQASELVRVTGIWDPSAEALARIGGLAPHAGSAASLIAGADCVYIASPPPATWITPVPRWRPEKRCSARSHWRSISRRALRLSRHSAAAGRR